ncbi:piggyBac transposable element-derived protein 4-like [Hyperolius riggenbachi]|uniref:piggyBac transposable element-derived protein 4-like n=1 Tax=Hyperolius riggenbachi TaxID=752182 RepID=UPI0035A28CCF
MARRLYSVVEAAAILQQSSSEDESGSDWLPSSGSGSGSESSESEGPPSRRLRRDPSPEYADEGPSGLSTAGSSVGDPASGSVGDPAEGSMGNPAEGSVGNPAEGSVGNPAAASSSAPGGARHRQGRQPQVPRRQEVPLHMLNGTWEPPNYAAPNIPPFTATAGVSVPIVNQAPIDIFQLFMTEAMWEHLVEQTNLFALQFLADHPTNYITRKWHPTNVPEMKAYVGLTLSMSITPKPQIKMYWSRDLYHTAPLYPAIMRRQRFELLFFHLNDNTQSVNHTDPDHDRLFKLRPLLTHLSAVFMDVYTPHREIAVDESLVPFHGRLSMKQYIPSKRARCGVKIYRACESGTGYTFTFKIYEGKDSILQPAGCPEYISTSGKIVVDLLNPLLHQGYHVYLDNFYTSVPLFKFLFSVQTGTCGTVRANRKGLPPQVVNKKLCRGESYALRSEELLALKFHDKREVMMLSTIHTEATVLATSRTEQRTKPEAIVAYNKNMGAVDLSDQVLAPYLLRRRRKAWYKKITFFLLQMTMHNAFVVYLKTTTTPTSQQMTFLEFQIQVHKSLMYSPGQIAQQDPIHLENSIRLRERHFPELIPPMK